MIQFMLEQEYDPDLDDEWLTYNDKLTCFNKAIYRIVGRVKGSESPYFQGTQSYEKDLVIMERVTHSTERSPYSELITNGNHVPVVQAQNGSSSANRK